MRHYLYGPAIDQVLAEEHAPSGSVQWLLADHQGTVRDLVDATGEVTRHIRYGAFGDVREVRDAQTGQLLGTGVAAAGTRYLYTGREWDEAARLYYYRARSYDPFAGRFTSEDPLGLAAGDANYYRYVGNGPGNGTDPSGLAGDSDTPASPHWLDQVKLSDYRWYDPRKWWVAIDRITDGPNQRRQIFAYRAWAQQNRENAPYPLGLCLDVIDASYGIGFGPPIGMARGTVGSSGSVGGLRATTPAPLRGWGNLGSSAPVAPSTALGGAEKWLGAGYREITPGVFRSADGFRQFRMTSRDLIPTHGRIGPHVHFEVLDCTGAVIENLHLPVLP